MKKLFSLSLLLSLVTVVMAEGITKEQALDRARQFMAKRNASFSQARSANGKSVNYSVSSLYDGKIYAVNAEGNGFVLVSGDDATDLILGYADNGTFTLDNAPDNVRYWMECYAEQMEAVAQGKGKLRSALVSTIKTPVEPLIQTQWGQDAPYNDQCVMTWDGFGSAVCLTGCAATAMAQVMNYHKHPTTEIAAMDSYKPWNNTTMSALPATTIDWSKMCDIYTGSETAEQKAEVAKLMRYCGQALNMQYDQNLSGASSAATYPALTDYFGYDKSLQLVYRHDYTVAEWDAIIYKEMKEGRPVIYNGVSTGGGHAFVVDGYDGDEHFHVNWGWAGMQDGYFLLSLMNALSNAGAGASTTPDGYTMEQMAFVNIKPSEAGASNLIVGVSHLKLEGNMLNMRYFKESGDDSDDVLGVAVINSSGQVTYFYCGNSNSYKTGTYDDFVGPDAINYQSFLTSMPDGDYRITGAYQIGGVWHTCLGGDVNYFSVTKTGSSYTNAVCHPMTDISVVSAELTGSREIGIVQEVKVTFQNDGPEDYQGNVAMIYSGNVCTKACVVVPAHSKATAYFYFTPSATGDCSLQFAEIVGESLSVIGNPHNVTIEGTVPSYLYVSDLVVDNVITDNTTHYLMGNVIHMTFTLRNLTNEPLSYENGDIYYEVTHQGSPYSGGLSEVTFPPGSYLTIEVKDYEHPERMITVTGTATIRFFNKKVSTETPIKEMVLYQLDDKVVVRDASGTTSVIANNATVPAHATSVDLRHLGTSLSEVALAPSANPNCLYYLAFGATTPACLSGENVVIGSTAASLALQPGYDFRPLADFTATSATFTRTFANGTDGSGSGWYGICLPFTVSSVAYDGKPLHWFNTSHPSADFWIYDFVSDNSTSVTFAKLEGSFIPANHPCIIAVPGNTWGAQYDLTNKSIVFSGSSVAIKADAASAATGSYFKFVGGYTANTVDAYLLNAAGSSFHKTPSGTSPQFGAYFVSVGASTSDVLDITIDNSDITAISSISAPSLNTGKVFNVMGQQVTPDAKGIKIIKGKKFVK